MYVFCTSLNNYKTHWLRTIIPIHIHIYRYWCVLLSWHIAGKNSIVEFKQNFRYFEMQPMTLECCGEYFCSLKLIFKFGINLKGMVSMTVLTVKRICRINYFAGERTWTVGKWNKCEVPSKLLKVNRAVGSKLQWGRLVQCTLTALTSLWHSWTLSFKRYTTFPRNSVVDDPRTSHV